MKQKSKLSDKARIVSVVKVWIVDRGKIKGNN